MAMMIPLFTAMGASAATAATIATVGTYAGAAMTVLGGISSANAQKDSADYNARATALNSQNAANAAQTNKNMLDAKATQEEAMAQSAAQEERHKLDALLSRAAAVAAAGGGGPPQESLISGLVERGEGNAQRQLYVGNEKGKTLRFQGESGVENAIAQGGLNNASAAAKKDQAYRSADATIIGSIGKGASMMSFASGPAPGAGLSPRPYADAYSDALYDN